MVLMLGDHGGVHVKAPSTGPYANQQQQITPNGLWSTHIVVTAPSACHQPVDVAECEVDALVEHGEWFWRGGGDPEIRHVILRPTMVFRGPRVTNRAELALHRETQQRCPLAKAVKCEARVNLLCEALVADGHD
jgi:hypothetical protein